MAFADDRAALGDGRILGDRAAAISRLSAEGLEVHTVARDAGRLVAISAETTT